MKGQITVYYDLPKLAIYLEKAGNRVTEQQVRGLIAEMIQHAAVLHMNEEAETISGTLMELFSTTDTTQTFENLPTDALHIYFGEDEKELAQVSQEIKRKTYEYLHNSAQEDVASRKDKVTIHKANLENLFLQQKNKEKIGWKMALREMTCPRREAWR